MLDNRWIDRYILRWILTRRFSRIQKHSNPQGHNSSQKRFPHRPETSIASASVSSYASSCPPSQLYRRPWDSAKFNSGSKKQRNSNRWNKSVFTTNSCERQVFELNHNNPTYDSENIPSRTISLRTRTVHEQTSLHELRTRSLRELLCYMNYKPIWKTTIPYEPQAYMNDNRT